MFLKVSWFSLHSVGHCICGNRWKEASPVFQLEAEVRTWAFFFFFFLSTDFWLLCQISKDFCKIRNRFWGRSWPLNELRVAQGRLYSPPILVNSTPASAYAVTQRLLYFAFFGVQGRVHFLREVTQVPSVTLFQTPPICSSKEELKIKKLSDMRASHISGLRKG